MLSLSTTVRSYIKTCPFRNEFLVALKLARSVSPPIMSIAMNHSLTIPVHFPSILSKEPDAIAILLGKKTTALTRSWWPMDSHNGFPGFPVVASHILIVPSCEADAIAYLSDEKATALAEYWWPISSRNGFPIEAFVVASHVITSHLKSWK